MGESLPTSTSLFTLTVYDTITLALHTLPTKDRQELVDALHRHPDGDFPRMCKPTNASNPRCLPPSSTFLDPPAFQAPVRGVGKIGSYISGQRA